MAETFHQFPDLPKELRLKIWQQAMIGACANRKIIIDEGRVVPFKEFISPLLLVNYESRTCAKAFYNVKLDIYAVPPVTQAQVEFLDKQEWWGRIKGSDRAVDGKIHGYSDEWLRNYFESQRWNIEMADEPDFYDEEKEIEIDRMNKREKEYIIDLEAHWSDFVKDQLRVLGAGSIRRAEMSGPTTGAFYISPEHDVFITDYDCTMNFSMDSASKILGQDFPNIRTISCRHISSKLSAATCQRVLTIVVFRNYNDARRGSEEKHCVFAENQTIQSRGGKNGVAGEFDRGWCRDRWTMGCCGYQRTWKKKMFPNIQAHFVLWNWDFEGDFLTNLTKMNDAELLGHLSLWEKDKFTIPVNFFSMRKVMRAFVEKKSYSLGEVDWVRDLMAKLDLSN